MGMPCSDKAAISRYTVLRLISNFSAIVAAGRYFRDCSKRRMPKRRSNRFMGNYNFSQSFRETDNCFKIRLNKSMETSFVVIRQTDFESAFYHVLMFSTCMRASISKKFEIPDK